MNLEPLFEAIVKDFARFDRTEERVTEFADSLAVEEGRKYLKVIKKLGRLWFGVSSRRKTIRSFVLVTF